MKKACVIGWPVSHSRSPIIHNYWLRKHGIAGSYTRQAVQPEELPEFMTTLADRGYEGCNVTIPHKEAAFKLVSIADEATQRLGVVNTIYHRDGQLLGTSTDGEGFMANLRASAPAYAAKNDRVMVLGAGGAAMAIVGALLDQGAAEVAVANRTQERSVALRKQFGQRVIPVEWSGRSSKLKECGLLVNSTALGMTAQPELDIDLSNLAASAVVCDIVYTPLESKLLLDAKRRGNVTVGGLGMLLYQAVRGFELWFGVRPEVTQELYQLVANDVSARERR